MTLQTSVGELVQIQFPAFDVDGITPLIGLLDSDFLKLLIVDSTVSGQSVTVSEIAATGRYVISFTPNIGGLWYAEVQTPVEDVFADQIEVGPPPIDWIEAIVEGVWSEVLAGTYVVDSAGWRLARTDDNVQSLHDALIMAVLTASGGGSDGIETNAAQVDGFYDGLTVVIRNASGNVARRVASYVQVDGVFYFDDELPFVPASGDEVIVLGILGKVLCEGSEEILDKLIEIWQRLGLDSENPLCITKESQEADGWKLVHSEIGNKLIVTREDV